MVTLQQQINETRKQFQQRREQIDRAKKNIPRITRERFLRERGTRGVQRRQQIVRARTEIQQASKQLSTSRGRFESSARSALNRLRQARSRTVNGKGIDITTPRRDSLFNQLRQQFIDQGRSPGEATALATSSIRSQQSLSSREQERILGAGFTPVTSRVEQQQQTAQLEQQLVTQFKLTSAPTRIDIPLQTDFSRIDRGKQSKGFLEKC